MANTSGNDQKIRLRDIHYYRQRYKNRVFDVLTTFYADEAERRGITQRDIDGRLDKDASQISRWLSQPGNLTLDTVSDLLLALDAEPEPPAIVRFADRTRPNRAHEYFRRSVGNEASKVVVVIESDNETYASTAVSSPVRVQHEGG